jgi:hypothetical protein
VRAALAVRLHKLPSEVDTMDEDDVADVLDFLSWESEQVKRPGKQGGSTVRYVKER